MAPVHIERVPAPVVRRRPAVTHDEAMTNAPTDDAATPFRCFGTGDPLYERYHDEEWGRPVRDDRSLYERMSLEAFQSGLAWITILRKREGFRAAFAGFDARVVAAFDERDVERLMADAGIVRNRMKIDATIANARALLALQEQGHSLTELMWSHAPADRGLVAELGQLPATTDASKALAKALKAAGFRFVGPTTAYAAMQACGLVNDHLLGCPVRDEVETERAAARRP
jgi:DNA-3-methyladenine glycosylase I